MDLDFIEVGLYSRAVITMCMCSLGFVEMNRYFKHSDTDLLVEFPAAPLGIGNEPITEYEEITTSVGWIRHRAYRGIGGC